MSFYHHLFSCTGPWLWAVICQMLIVRDRCGPLASVTRSLTQCLFCLAAQLYNVLCANSSQSPRAVAHKACTHQVRSVKFDTLTFQSGTQFVLQQLCSSHTEMTIGCFSTQLGNQCVKWVSSWVHVCLYICYTNCWRCADSVIPLHDLWMHVNALIKADWPLFHCLLGLKILILVLWCFTDGCEREKLN